MAGRRRRWMPPSSRTLYRTSSGGSGSRGAPGWVTLTHQPCKEAYHVPENLEPVAVFPVGLSCQRDASPVPSTPSAKPLEEIVIYNPVLIIKNFANGISKKIYIG